MAKTLSKAKKEFKPDYKLLLEVSHTWRAINHKKRQQMLDLLDRNGEMTVGSLQKKLRIEQSLTSAFLGILRKAGLVLTRREGHSIFYRVNYDKLQMLEEVSKRILL